MSLSTPDKVLRLSLSTYPPRLDLSQFYPALSTYRVQRRFERAELEKAVGHFLAGNPFFSKCYVTEWEFESDRDFPLSSFQEILNSEYPNYFDGFMVASVTFSDQPDVQGVFTAFPISLQDGYRCFHFHQTLMRSLKTERDEFAIGQRLDELGVRAGELAAYLPELDASPNGGGASVIPFDTAEDVGDVLKVGEYLNTVRARFLERSSENLFIIKNALGASYLPIGNFLLFAHIPHDVVLAGDGSRIHEYSKTKAAELMRGVESLETREDFVAVGSSLIPNIAANPNRYIVNNYGNATAFDGSDTAPAKGRLVKFQWYMPALVLGLLSGERDGASWTVTIRDKAFNFSSL